MSNVIKHSNIPTRLPVLATCVAYLLLDKFNPPGWVWGCVITLFVLLWIISIYAICCQNTIDILNYKKDDEQPVKLKSKWEQKIDDLKGKNSK